MPPTEPHETLDDHAFIELVKDFIGSVNVLPVMNLLHDGQNTMKQISASMQSTPNHELQSCIDKMIKFAIVQPLTRGAGDVSTAWFLTPVGQEFRLILLDIERLKRKYRE